MYSLLNSLEHFKIVLFHQVLSELFKINNYFQYSKMYSYVKGNKNKFIALKIFCVFFIN